MKFKKFKMADGRRVENHRLANAVKFCVGKQYFTALRQWDRYPSTERIFVF